MTRILTLITLLTITACSGVSNVSYQRADGTFHNQRTVSDPHAFAPTAQRSWLEICQPIKGTTEPDYMNCTEATDPRYATTSGYADGIGTAVVQGGAFVGGMYLLGQGIADSGSVTNQSGGGATSQSNAVNVQSQSQSQVQSQHQFNTPGHRR